jgi:hypothetical protein
LASLAQKNACQEGDPGQAGVKSLFGVSGLEVDQFSHQVVQAAGHLRGREMAKIFNLGHKPPSFTKLHGRDAYWISVSPGHQPGDGGLLLGREFDSLEELEKVAADIRSDLKRVIAEAREKLRIGAQSRRAGS